jgi:peptidoglycan/xylan/chitin deacetylase (PgdA/CDA1 family)
MTQRREARAADSSLILTYHSLDSSGSVISFPPSLFQEHMARIADSGVSVVKLSEVCTTTGSIAITFDDAFGNFVECAMPSLVKYRFPATVFVVSGYCGLSNDWATQPVDIPRMPLMSWEDIRSLPREQIQIGAHTVSHPDLTRLARHQVEGELFECKRQIEDHIGGPVETFAYPYGTCSAEVRGIAHREFSVACGTRMGFAGGTSDRWNLPRIDAYYLRRLQPVDLLTLRGRVYVNARAVLRKMKLLLAR